MELSFVVTGKPKKGNSKELGVCMNISIALSYVLMLKWITSMLVYSVQ